MIGLNFKQLSKSYPTPDGGAVTALKDFSLTIEPGEFVVIVGANGSGKSTLLNLVAGKERCDSGAIIANVANRDQDWTRASRRSRSRYIARIHQQPTLGSAEGLTVIEHIRLAHMRGPPSPFVAAVSRDTKQALSQNLQHGSLASKSDALVDELSYGQRQLLALEMARVRSAQVLLLDEPTASLDSMNAQICLQRVQRIRDEQGATILFVTHDMALAAQYGDRLVVLKGGRLNAVLGGKEKSALRPEDVFHLTGFDQVARTEVETVP